MKKQNNKLIVKYNVELIEDYYGIPKGAKGIDLEPYNYNPYVEWDKHYDCTYTRKVDGVKYKNVFSVHRNNLKSINNKEEK